MEPQRVSRRSPALQSGDLYLVAQQGLIVPSILCKVFIAGHFGHVH